MNYTILRTSIQYGISRRNRSKAIIAIPEERFQRRRKTEMGKRFLRWLTKPLDPPLR